MTTQTPKSPGSLDTFRLAAAFLVVAIHTSPLSSVNTTADFLFTRIIARIAVPFFLMVSGYFVLSGYFLHPLKESGALSRFIKKGLLLYAAAGILYLPVNLYAGHFEHMRVYDVFRSVLFDGVFYHLWYLPASLMGMVLLCLLSRRLSFPAVSSISLLLYGIGLCGDSYYGLVSACPVAKAFYNMLFQIFTYTRNGIFYAPVFLVMGAQLAIAGPKHPRQRAFYGFLLSLAGMLGEGMLLHTLDLQRHDSMYIFLLPCMYFLFTMLLEIPGKSSRQLRFLATWIYILHPLMIVLVRGVAKLTHLTGLLVENSLIHYLAVCGTTAAVAILLWTLVQAFRNAVL